MSVRQMSLVFERSRSKGAARLVLLALADVAADDGEITAYRRSQSVLAKKANITTEGVRKALRALEELGELEVLVQGNGRTRSDYRILLDPPTLPPPALGADPNPDTGQPPTELGAITPSLDDSDPSPISHIREARKRLNRAG